MQVYEAVKAKNSYKLAALLNVVSVEDLSYVDAISNVTENTCLRSLIVVYCISNILDDSTYGSSAATFYNASWNDYQSWSQSGCSKSSSIDTNNNCL